MVADRVRKDICVNVDSDQRPILKERNQAPKNGHLRSEKNPHLTKFELRPNGDGYSEDEDISSNEDISRHERDYKAPYPELEPRTPQKPLIDNFKKPAYMASNPNTIANNTLYLE